MTKPATTSNKSLTHKHLELIRRLEEQAFIFASDPQDATQQAKQKEGSPFEKLVWRATLIDSNHQLMHTLQKSQFLFQLAIKSYSALYFLLSFIGVFGLLNTQMVSFFYVLVGLLGWHSFTLILWIVGLKRQASYSGVYLLLDKFSPKKAAENTAFNIHLDEFKRSDRWLVGMMIHRAWLFGLLGSLLALLLLFLFKNYAFVWESTLLSTRQFEQLLSIFGSLPSLFGFSIPTQIHPITEQTAKELAILIMASVVIYGIFPRLLAYLYCAFLAKSRFRIDENLYYYQHLLKQFSKKIIDQDDFRANPIKKLTKAQISTGKKIIATLEYRAKNDWYEEKVNQYSQNIGTLDTNDDLKNAIALANNNQAQLYLGINPKLLPDRGVLRKFDTLIHSVHYGLVVQFIGEGDHLGAWQNALIARDVPQVE